MIIVKKEFGITEVCGTADFEPSKKAEDAENDSVVKVHNCVLLK